MLGWLWWRIVDPRVDDYLLVHRGERTIDVVGHHWVVYIVPTLEAVVALVFAWLVLWSDVDVAWVPLFLSLGFGGHAAWGALNHYKDRFVITNMRVFRVRGVIAQQRATMPISRILDITVRKPVVGRFLRYGHFVFESAAQEQGLRDIRYVSRPDDRDKTIQDLVQRSGLRASVEQIAATE